MNTHEKIIEKAKEIIKIKKENDKLYHSKNIDTDKIMKNYSEIMKLTIEKIKLEEKERNEIIKLLDK